MAWTRDRRDLAGAVLDAFDDPSGERLAPRLLIERSERPGVEGPKGIKVVDRCHLVDGFEDGIREGVSIGKGRLRPIEARQNNFPACGVLIGARDVRLFGIIEGQPESIAECGKGPLGGVRFRGLDRHVMGHVGLGGSPQSVPRPSRIIAVSLARTEMRTLVE